MATALLVDVAKGDRVQFTEGFSGGTYPAGRLLGADNPRSGVFNATPSTSKVFVWTADNLRIDRVFLYVHNITTKKSTTIGTGFALSTGPSKLTIRTAGVNIREDIETATERRSTNHKRQQIGDPNLRPRGINNPIALEGLSKSLPRL